MAYIPDEAVHDSCSLSDSAYKIYCLLCARRNHKSQQTYATAQTIIRLLGISKATTYRGIAELESKLWVERKASVYRLLKGDFSPMDNRTNGSLKNGTKSLTIETEKSHLQDSRNIYHERNTTNNLTRRFPRNFKIENDLYESYKRRVEQSQFSDSNRSCEICLDTGIDWRHPDRPTCRCQPTLFDS